MFAQVTGFRKFNTQKSFIKSVCWGGSKNFDFGGGCVMGLG